MTVLIADDENYMVEYVKRLVDWESYGFDKVMTAGGGSLARDLLVRHRPELLITDIKMPKVTGLDLSRIIEELELDTKVIIMSGYNDFEYAKQAIRYGVSEYLVKPVLKEDLERTLDRILHRDLASKTESKQKAITGDKATMISYVKSYISENYDKDLSLDTLGALVNLHPVYLSKIFKETAGTNLSGYITEVKMQKAAELLVQTNKKVQEVVEAVGYQKKQHFTKLFKDRFGMTPKEYRMKNM